MGAVIEGSRLDPQRARRRLTQNESGTKKIAQKILQQTHAPMEGVCPKDEYFMHIQGGADVNNTRVELDAWRLGLVLVLRGCSFML